MSSSSGSWRSEGLGEAKTLRLRQGTLRYHDVGAGPLLVFIHGALVNANVWRKVVARLSPQFRCVTLDLPFGAHLEPMPPEADLSPPAFADLVADAIRSIGVDGATLVANDTGGAIAQLVVTRRPEGIDRLVLTSCESFDYFPAKLLVPVRPLLLVPGAIRVLFAPGHLRIVRRYATVLLLATKRRIEQEASDSYALPPLESAGVRRDLRKVMKGVNKRFTLEAAKRLPRFDRPALIAWSVEDKYFRKSHAERLAKLLPNSRLEWVEDSWTFSPEDQPQRIAELIADFMRGAGAADTGAARATPSETAA